MFGIAFLSLRAQMLVLLGHNGLAPAATFLAESRAAGAQGWDVPTLFVLGASDTALNLALWGGLGACALALLGLWPRVMFALAATLYASFVAVGAPFFNFQWDNLLIESGVLAAFLPWGRAAPRRHLLFRLLLFKLYVESGLGKWQSPLGDWQDGTALQTYFETAPLPTFVAWYAHHLPATALRVATWATLGLELGVPWLIFFGRRPRLLAAALLTAFQLLNVATANYGFFAFLAVALHLFLLVDADVGAIERDLRAASGMLGRLAARRLGEQPRQKGAKGAAWAQHLRQTCRTWWAPWARRLGRGEALVYAVFAATYVYVSCADGLRHFGPVTALGPPLAGLAAKTHTINTYRLFGAITPARIEAEIQVDDGQGYVPALMWHKPGDIGRAPNFVSPHQPRVDFQLWFHGLRRQQIPAYLHNLVAHLCYDPEAVWPLFRPPLPENIRTVRILYWRYTFTTPAERQRTGNWWQRTYVSGHVPMHCRDLPPPAAQKIAPMLTGPGGSRRLNPGEVP